VPPDIGTVRERLDVWRTMLRIRRLEEAVLRLAEDPSRPIRGHVHVYIGQEATGTGGCAALRDGDYLFTTHRNHGHVLARGGEPSRILAEILGRVDGSSQGRAGGFHVAAPPLGVLHTSAIVGGNLPLAAGAALAAMRQGSGAVALAFFGDGAMEEGVFSETLNIAQLWRLPVIFLMENNSVSPLERSGRGSPTSEHSASALADVPRAFGLATEVVDGTDVEQVLDATTRAVAAARAGRRPAFIESRTARWPGNYGSSPTLSLSGETRLDWAWTPGTAPEPVRSWVEHSDPLLMLARRLLRSGEVAQEELLRLDAEVQHEMRAAVDFALASPEPSAEEVAKFVLAPLQQDAAAAAALPLAPEAWHAAGGATSQIVSSKESAPRSTVVTSVEAPGGEATLSARPATSRERREVTYVQAMAEALEEILTEDSRVILFGANFVGAGPNRALMAAIQERFAERIMWPPIAELGYCGVAIGAAMAGMRPIVDLSTATFSYEAIPQIVNEAAIAYANSAGQTRTPVVFHMLYGLRGGGAAQHSGSPQGWYWNTPGLQVAMPGSPLDVKGLLRWAALKSESPTMFMSHQRLFGVRGPMPEGGFDIPFGQAEVKRQGADLSIIACGVQVPRALEAAEVLAREAGLDCEVVDPRTLQPLDLATMLGSVRKTGRVIVTDESHDTGGVAAGLAAIIADEAFDSLRAPIKRVSTLHVPVPYARTLEDAIAPTVERIAAAGREIVGHTPPVSTR
jgi:2-oxoisovalerate dehydrogenase E1 component